jgi:hypothetical protein
MAQVILPVRTTLASLRERGLHRFFVPTTSLVLFACKLPLRAAYH